MAIKGIDGASERGGDRGGHVPPGPPWGLREPVYPQPHLDEFARSSVVFDRHVISSFATMPARAEMLTGTFSYTHMGWEPLPRHLTTLPEVLSKAGYLTMGVVDTPFVIPNGFKESA
jgi:arylsulfatase A-like enzyme